VFLALLLGPFPVLAQTPESTERQGFVKEIAVEGSRRVQEAVIVGRVSARIGGRFIAKHVAEDIRRIFALGFFDDIQVRVEEFEGGLKLVYVVVERPFVRDILLSGNKKHDSSTLLEKIALKLGRVYDPVEVNRSADKLKEFYEQEGYLEAGITPAIEKLPDGDVIIAFQITEGRRITIDRIVVEGAKGLTPEEVKAAMETQEREFVILRGIVRRQTLDDDVDRIVQLYNDHGYVQARVESVETIVSREKPRATVRIVVVEGLQFKVGGVDVTGNSVLPLEEIRRRMELKPGEVFSQSALRHSIQGIADLYGAIGRVYTDVYPHTVEDSPNRLVNIVVEIVEGPETYVERINISGNTRTEEKVLRRELPIAEGDLFTSQKLAELKQRIANLKYFDRVTVTTAPGTSEDRIINTERDALARALAVAALPLERGIILGSMHGTAIAAEYTLEGGTLLLSVYTLKADMFSKVIVDVRAGAIARVEAITRAGDLTAAQGQKAAMARAARSLEAATADAVTAHPGYRAVSALPSLAGDRPVLEVVLVRGREWKVVREPLS
jgi:outer membrane protein insertion porin family